MLVALRNVLVVTVVELLSTKHPKTKTLTPNPLLFTYLIVDFTPSVFLLAFGL